MTKIVFVDTSGMAMAPAYSTYFRDYLEKQGIEGFFTDFAGLEISGSVFGKADIFVSLLNQTPKTNERIIRRSRRSVPILNFRMLLESYGSEEGVFKYLVENFRNVSAV